MADYVVNMLADLVTSRKNGRGPLPKRQGAKCQNTSRNRLRCLAWIDRTINPVLDASTQIGVTDL